MQKNTMTRALLTAVAVFTLGVGQSAPAWAHDNAPAITQAEASAFMSAQDLYKKEKHREVLEKLRSFVDAKRPHPYAVTIYGLSALALKKEKLAIDVFEKGVSIWPQNASLHQNYAVALMSGEKFLRAGDVFLETVELVKKESVKNDMRRSAGSAYYQARAWKRVRPALGPLAALTSDDVQALKLAGGADLQLRNWARAESTFERVLVLEPDSRRMWQTLASIRMTRGNRVEAAPAVETAAFLESREAHDKKESVKTRYAARHAAANLYGVLRAPHLELESLEKLPAAVFHDKTRKKEADKRPAEVVQLERILSAQLRAGNRKAALETNAKLIEIDANSARHTMAGSLLYQMGDIKAARAAYARDRSKGIGGDRNRFFAALLAWEMGERKAAKAGFKTVSEKSGFYSQARNSIRAIDYADELELSLTMDEPLAEQTYKLSAG